MSKGRPRMILKICDWVTADAIKNNLDEIGEEHGKEFPGTEEPVQPKKEEPKDNPEK